MASRFPLELELTVSAARDLKNVNWKYGDLHPYVVAWVDPDSKVTTRVSDDGDTDPVWNEKLTIPIRSRIEDAELSLDVVHANASGDTKPLVGSARLSLREVVDQVGYGERFMKTLKLKRPSGRPHGKIEIKAAIRENRYSAPDPYAQPYGTRNYGAPQPAGYGYGAAPQPSGYGAAPQPAGYGYGAAAPYGSGYGSGYGAPQYGSAAPPPQYGSAAPSPVNQPYYGGGGGGYGGAPPVTGPVVAEQPQKSKMGGMGAGLAVGAVAGVLGGLALAGGADYVGDKIAEKAAEKVEEDYSYGGGDGGGDYDDDY